MSKKIFILPLALVLVGIFVFFSTVFVVDEREQFVITRLGKPVRVVDNPGLSFKMPLLEKATVFSKQILDYDADADEVITKDKKPILADTFAKWRIDDPVIFLQTVRTEEGARLRLDDIIYSVAREELGSYNFADIINDRYLMQKVTDKVNEQAVSYGVVVLDVRMKRADLSDQNQKSVFANMASEREQTAAKYLSEGDREALMIQAAADRRATEIIADAYRESQGILGEGEKEAAVIYADAYGKDISFYKFFESLNTYREAFQNETTLFIPINSDLAQYLLNE